MLQLDMFNYKDYRGNDIIKELQNIDMLNITPIEAINLLYNLVQRAKKV
ncbi:hypothetical protein Q428_09280 [Fervidicella metallireducens AeB]|uniref:DNA mismatch repair protein MutS n=1 Tax=Fervidicella metallireducens AeB TaxID=1403537 RepID=A0A017RTX2_9CLOT|nr:hypothetical protein Q428_09280 [Fervidicella metallireducens AeB]